MDFVLSDNVSRYSDASDSEPETRHEHSNAFDNVSASPSVGNDVAKQRYGIKESLVSDTDTEPLRESVSPDALEQTLGTPPRSRTKQFDTLDPIHEHLLTAPSQALPAPDLSASEYKQKTQTDKLSNRAARDLRWQQPTSTSLSVFNSPTATYAWPNLQPSSQMDGRPVVYVRYEQNTPTAADPDNLVNPNVHTSEDPSTALSTLSRKRRSSAGSRDNESVPINGMIEPLKRIHIAEPACSNLGRKGIFDVPQIRDQFKEHELPAMVHIDSPTTSISSFSRDEATPDAIIWEDHAQLIKGPDGDSLFRCMWISKEKDPHAPCSYTAKKQLVKRHIETTHLKIRLHVCDVCGKKFPQKTSLDTHRHGHTGSKPHACKYDCGTTFKDPARRHRHMVEAHGYVPRQSRRKYAQTDKVVSEPSEYESIQPWVADLDRIAGPSRLD